MKENLVKVLKNNGKKIVVIIVLIVFIFALITGALRYLKNELGKSNDSDPKNGPSAAKKFIQATTIDDDGNITFSQTISEYWEELKKNNNKLTELLSSPEELAKLINAQVATEYLDTRENPDDPIDWDAINKDVDSTSVQGIIKLKRALEDGTTITMTYVSPKEFQSYIDEYNKSGSEKAKENALKHFTIDKTGSSASGSAGILTGSGNFTKYTDLTDAQIKALAVVCYHEQGSLKGAAAEASLMANLFEIKGSSYSSVYDYVKNSGWFALNGYNMDTENIGDDYINVVRAVLVEGKRTIPGYIDEHDYVGDIISVTNNGETINKSDKSKYIQHVTKIKTVYGATYTFYSYPAENSDPFGYTSEERRQKIGDAYYDFDTGVLMNGSNTSNVADSNTQNNSSVETVNNVNESTNSGILTWPLPGYTDLSSEYGYRNCPYHGYEFHDGIDIPAPSGTEVLAADGGVVTTAEYHSSFGNYVIIDHGNGYKTQYNHNSKLNVSKGQTVSKGQVISYVGTTGTSTGNHLDFRILNSKNESMNPMDFKYDNGVGNGSKSYSNSEIQGNDNNTSSSSTSQYVAKVATWSENQKITETNDSSVEINDYHNYNMSTQTIPYHDFVSKYEMPFSYLWILLIYSEDKDFVFDLADLVYGSEFEITIHDNYTKTTNVVKNLYQKKTRYVTDAVNVKVTYSDYIDPQYSTSGGSNIPDEGEETLKETTVNVPGQKGEKTKIAPSSSEFYHVIETTINKNNTLDISLTKANAWCADYEQEYTYGHTDEELVGENKTNLADTEEITDEQFYDNDPGGVAEEIRQRVLSEYSGHTTCVAKVTSSRTLCYYSTIGRVRYTEDYLETSNYVSSPGKIKEKTDKNATEPNFVTILCENYNARSNILSCESWLFDTLGDNDDTKDLVDLTKYLLYKVTGKDYGVTQFDFSVFDPANFMNVNNLNGLGDIPLYEPLTTKEDFIKAMNEFSNKKTGELKSNFDKHFLSRAGEIYDLGIKYSINPELIVTFAWREQAFKDPVGDESNFWGIAVYNGQTTAGSYGNFEGGVKALSKVFHNYDAGSGTWQEERILELYNERHEYNSNGCGQPGTLRGLMSLYGQGLPENGTHTWGSWGAGGRIYLKEAYGDEYDAKCGNVHKDGEPYTIQEYADVGAYYYEHTVELWEDLYGNYATIPTGTGASLLEVADQIHRDEINWTYSQESLYWYDIEKSLNNPNKTTCCATYVNCVIYKAGLATEQEMNSFNYNSATATYNHFKYKGWQEIQSYDSLEAGDIVFMTAGGSSGIGHVQLYAGNGTWYNAGSTSAIQRASPYKGNVRSRFITALRPPTT